MNDKYFRNNNNLYNLSKLISVEVELDKNRLTLTFDGGIEKILSHESNEKFMKYIFNPLSEALGEPII